MTNEEASWTVSAAYSGQSAFVIGYFVIPSSFLVRDSMFRGNFCSAAGKAHQLTKFLMAGVHGFANLLGRVH